MNGLAGNFSYHLKSRPKYILLNKRKFNGNDSLFILEDSKLKVCPRSFELNSRYMHGGK